MAGARFCSQCGQPLDAPAAPFCPRCGAAATASAVPPATPGLTPLPMRIGGTSAQRLLLFAAIAVVIVAAVGAVIALALSGPGGFSGIRVLAPTNGCWSGAISGPGSMSSVDGCGPKDYPLSCGGAAIVSLIKNDAGSWILTAEIVSNGRVVQESSTSTPYGGVSVVGNC